MTMELIQSENRFVFRCDYEHREVPKAAGFRWDNARKQWWTDQQERAARLARFAQPTLKGALEEYLQATEVERQATAEASRATYAEIAVPAPDGLAYLPYQRAGIAFASSRPNVLIGDDMGLGKTIQAIGTFNADPDIRSVLIICPASLKLNWAREWQKWATRRCTVDLAEGPHFPRHTDIAIINYDIVSKHRAAIDAKPWDLLIVDECHALKNSKAQRTQAILGGGKRGADRVEPIRARRRIFLTGTPILNRPAELWTLAHSLDPRGLGADFWHFHKRYCNAHNNGYGWDFGGASNLEELQAKLRQSIMIRRLKADVLTELPPKRRQIVALDPRDAAEDVRIERTAYEEAKERIAELRARVALADANEDREAYDAAVRRLRAASASLFEDMSKLRHKTAVAKIPLAIEHTRAAIEASGKVIVFAYHLDVIQAIAAEFPGESVVITGQTAIAARQAAVDRFQSDPRCTLFIGNILAAGVGITLTASSHVVFAELDWRPGIVTQAEDRAHRIGQHSNVLVQHLVFDNSLDAVMARRIVAKQDVIDRALDKAGQDEIEEEDDPLEEAIAAAETRPEMEGHQPQAQQAQDPSKPPAATPALTGEQIAAVHAALRLLAGHDLDRAGARNDIGFNKADTIIGHDLADRSSLSMKQAVLGRRVVRKYHRQIGQHLIEAMGRET